MKVKSNGNGGVSAVIAEGEKEFRLIPLERTSKHSKIPNREIDDAHVLELKKSIVANGLDTPLSIWGGEKPGTMMKMKEGEVPAAFVAAGFHRRKAIFEIKEENESRFNELFGTGVPCLVHYGDLKDVLLLQLRENVNRKDPSAEEILPFVRRLRKEFKMEQKELAKEIGKSTAWVSMILDIENQLGEEATDEVAKGGVSIREARKVAQEVKEERKAGKTPDIKEKVGKLKAKAADKKSKGRKRAERRVSIKVLFKRYRALPGQTMGERVRVLEEMIEYVIEEADSFPPELDVEDEEDAPKKKKKV